MLPVTCALQYLQHNLANFSWSADESNFIYSIESPLVGMTLMSSRVGHTLLMKCVVDLSSLGSA